MSTDVPDDADSPHEFESLSSHDVDPETGPDTEPVEPITSADDREGTPNPEPPAKGN